MARLPPTLRAPADSAGGLAALQRLQAELQQAVDEAGQHDDGLAHSLRQGGAFGKCAKLTCMNARPSRA